MSAPLFDPDSLDNRDATALRRVFAVVDPWLAKFYAPEVRGLSRIPAGPALYVANHNGGVLMPDAWAVASAIFHEQGLDDLPFALAHDLALKPAALNRLLCPLGAVRAREDTAERVFARGNKALVFPGGDLEVMRPFARRDEIEFGPRRGYLRLAIRNGVPISPIVTAGAHAGFVVLDDGRALAKALGLPRWGRVNVCPIVLSVPWGVTIGFPPPYLPVPGKMLSEVLAPIVLPRSGEAASRDTAYVEECHELVAGEMQRALTRLAVERTELRNERLSTGAHAMLDRALDALGLAPHHAPVPPRPAKVSPLPRAREQLVRVAEQHGAAA